MVSEPNRETQGVPLAFWRYMEVSLQISPVQSVQSIQCRLNTMPPQYNAAPIQCRLNTMPPQYNAASIQCRPQTAYLFSKRSYRKRHRKLRRKRAGPPALSLLANFIYLRSILFFLPIKHRACNHANGADLPPGPSFRRAASRR